MLEIEPIALGELWDTYNGNFATELVFDLAGFDRLWRILADQLVKVLNTHPVRDRM